jgi:hypothetical protein
MVSSTTAAVSAAIDNQSGPAAHERPGPGTEGSTSMQSNRTPKRSASTTRNTPAKKAPSKEARAKDAALAKPTSRAGEPRAGSTMWAVLRVLQGAQEPMGAKAIYAEIDRRDLAAGLKGKTPEATVAAALAVAAKQGRHVERTSPGKFRVLQAQS